MKTIGLSELALVTGLLLIIGCSPTSSDDIRRQFVESVPGSVITIPAGRYEFDRSLVARVDDLVIRGEGQDQSILSFAGQKQGAEGILLTGDRLHIEGIAIEDTKGDALKINQSQGVVIRDVRTEWTRGSHMDNGAYGIYPVQCENVLIDHAVAIGASDAGIYVGQSKNIIVRDSLARANVAGIEIENSTGADVYGNHVYDNTGGILVFDLPNLPVQGGQRTRVFRNNVIGNNTPNFAPPGNTVAGVPAGTGIMVSANDDIEIFENVIARNETANVLVVSYLITGNDITDPLYDPYPERIHIHDNVLEGGGTEPDSQPLVDLIARTSDPVPDIVWDGFLNEESSGPVLCMHSNGDADFVNLNAPGGFEALFDAKPYECSLPNLPAISI